MSPVIKPEGCIRYKPGKMKNKNQLYGLIYKHIANCALPHEVQELQEWRQAEPENEALFQRITRAEGIKASFQVYGALDVQAAYKKIMKTPSGSEKHVIGHWMKYAAAILIPVALAMVVYLLTGYPKKELAEKEVIQPGYNQAILVLSNGQNIALVDTAYRVLEEDGEIVGKDSLNILKYVKTNSQKLVYNTIKVPYGGEYQVVLSDGSKVWLNAGSELNYPVNFVDANRSVSLKGEAYFEVSPDKERPFIVNTEHSKIKVFGTAFNVMSYEEDKEQQVTLIEGSVGVDVKGHETLLKPGQQARVDKHGAQIEVSEVDVALYTSWTGGVLKFKNMPLRHLAARLSRWYNVDFYFANSTVPQMPFTGRVDKHTDFAYFMSLIEKTTNVEVTINGRSVLIKEVK